MSKAFWQWIAWTVWTLLIVVAVLFGIANVASD
jgi:hypothetical protein